MFLMTGDGLDFLINAEKSILNIEVKRKKKWIIHIFNE